MDSNIPVQQEVNPIAFYREISSTVSEMVEEAAEEQYWDENNDSYIAEKVVSLLYENEKAFYEWRENL